MRELRSLSPGEIATAIEWAAREGWIGWPAGRAEERPISRRRGPDESAKSPEK